MGGMHRYVVAGLAGGRGKGSVVNTHGRRQGCSGRLTRWEVSKRRRRLLRDPSSHPSLGIGRPTIVKTYGREIPGIVAEAG